MTNNNGKKPSKNPQNKNDAPILGSIAKSASVIPPSDTAGGVVFGDAKNAHKTAVKKSMDSMLRRFALQSVSRRLLPSHRVGQCLRRIIPTLFEVKVVKSKSKGTAGYRNLIRCGLLWACPVCAAAITEKRSAELQSGVARWHADEGFVIFATYTMQHHAGASLANTLETLKKALKRFKSGRAYQEMIEEFGIVGTVKALEITYGENGWHPHVHELIFCLPMSQRAVYRFINQARERWIISLRKEGGDGIPNKAYTAKTADTDIYDYVAKYGHEPAGNNWTIEREVIKAPSKLARAGGLTPFQMLETAESDAKTGNLFVEYVHTMHGVRQLVWSKGLREKLGLEDEKTDEQLAGEQAEIEEDFSLLATIEAPDWSVLLHMRGFNGDIRAEVLRVCLSGDADALNDLIKRARDSKNT